ncbi:MULTISPECIES: N-acetylmannosamine-6-phosphate 2-epimerase [unclassified Streptomyces]|uniref:N-acetylmannosamine-6-phosphate 2-epimerase n=1 Tax=unclassified Streptomyces TaxID=2593676 RepID=UPI0022508EC7|nr:MULTISPECIES: N-acetylmannosamine-6-phosphate 2-epimerase [unclassified Streptomyces]WSP58391.1 N-acetylmannosamine-6-phosphate 2-epimerase [Streptomyces sp. NBC_01241]WSU21034.1 N-acetylmannosamine-6-phosphate 2-epimerase [Streptomyces sp. NBC_01108]MCX4790145.1 N-acetylmannosamine-6-phosphate 2-epimerase [Streptomyces sp. NBC_01221]MCX4794127.1 N-acetylmannosamine-6-phosphate 2-epimerase [Streptomyces sp. NBC_01242]WSJ35527.1 N-acetylmannosamine-6-phosphate 2-epimerase [Streptomyces sp. N
MTAQELADSLQGKLIVSCQAPPGDPMRETGTLVRLARSAVAGGCAAIRANEPEVVAAIVEAVDLPVIGLWKDGDVGVYITPTVRHALAVAEAGAAVVAADATDRPRPDGSTFAELVMAVHAAGALVMADVSTLAEGVTAAGQGADFVSTTLSGYVPGTPKQTGPDLDLVAALSTAIDVPVVAEGRINTPEDAAEALARGAHSVVVGTAITAPTALTTRFVAGMTRP